MQSYKATGFRVLSTPQSSKSLNSPTKNLDRRERAQERRELNFQVDLNRADLKPEDCDFLLEKRKQDIHRDSVFLDMFSLIRKYDFLPKSVISDCFTRSLKYVYDIKEIEEKEKAAREKLSDQEEN